MAQGERWHSENLLKFGATGYELQVTAQKIKTNCANFKTFDSAMAE
jgi:hypothetical protein